MKDDQLDRMVRDADVYKPAVIGHLDGVSHSLLEEIMSVPTVENVIEESAPDPVPARQRSRRLRVVRSAIAVVAAITAAVLGAFLMRPAAAFAVEDLGNGLVRIEITKDFDDPSALERKLRDLGLKVKVLTVRQDRCESGRLAALTYDIPAWSWSPERSTSEDFVTWDSKHSYTLDTKKIEGSLRLYVSAPEGIPFSRILNRPEHDDVNKSVSVHLGDFGCFDQEGTFKIEKDPGAPADVRSGK